MSAPRDGAGAALPWVLSAPDEPALRARARQLRDHVAARPELAPADVGWTLAGAAAGPGARAVVVGADRDALLAGLDAVARGAPAAGVARGAAGPADRVAFVFPGQGSQWPGMALELMAQSPGFAASMRECEAALAPHVDWRLDDVLGAADDDPLWERSDIVQPALFCVMVSLAAMWRSFGVRPDAVVGHSLGEISAACVAGILSLEDAARVAALTSRALHGLGGDDGMVLVDLAAEPLRSLVARVGGRLTLAAFNGPRAIVVSGEPTALDALLAACEADGVRARRIRVDGTSSVAHSEQIEAIRERLAEDLADVAPRPSAVVLLLGGHRRADRPRRARSRVLVPQPAPAGLLRAGDERPRARRRLGVRRVQPAPRPRLRRRGHTRGRCGRRGRSRHPRHRLAAPRRRPRARADLDRRGLGQRGAGRLGAGVRGRRAADRRAAVRAGGRARSRRMPGARRSRAAPTPPRCSSSSGSTRRRCSAATARERSRHGARFASSAWSRCRRSSCATASRRSPGCGCPRRSSTTTRLRRRSPSAWRRCSAASARRRARPCARRATATSRSRSSG